MDEWKRTGFRGAAKIEEDIAQTFETFSRKLTINKIGYGFISEKMSAHTRLHSTTYTFEPYPANAIYIASL